MKWSSHPRLYVTGEQIRRLRTPPAIPALRAAAHRVARDAEQFVRGTEFEYPRSSHNAHLIRARIAQKRVVTLLVRYFQTGESRFRAAALAHIDAMGNWEYWSWIAWRAGKPDPRATFDLSYGENSATLAIAYDWLHNELTATERSRFAAIARRRSLTPYLRHTRPGKALGWFKHAESNWNAVCNGGAGMLALALREDLPEAPAVLARVEQGIRPFMNTLQKTDGAWIEGLGYWNYGMRYAFLYLLSHENATGRRHPLLHRAATRATLRFPLDFYPHGVPCGFGDINTWRPMPFHYEAARKLGVRDVIAALDSRDSPDPERASYWPNDAELLLLHPRSVGPSPKPKTALAKIYRAVDWGILADRLPNPRLFLAVRGGTTEGPHCHRDLLSFHAVVGNEALVTNLGIMEYLDTTFSLRRYELFETMPASKNTLLINGVGVAGKSRVETQRLRVNGRPGIRLEATAAMGRMRDGPVAKFCGRLFVLLPGPAALIVDRAQLSHTGRVEARFHTRATVRMRTNTATLTGKRQRMTLAFAGNVPSRLHRAVTAATTPTEAVNVLRWCTDTLHSDMILATLLCPGRAAAAVSLRERNQAITIRAKIGSNRFRVALTRELMPQR